MNLKNQRKIAAGVLNIGVNRVWFDEDRLEEIKEAITKSDIRGLINDKAIQAKPEVGNSRSRVRKRLIQKRKGRLQGKGKRQGKKSARLSKKEKYVPRIRLQRDFLKELKTKKLINPATFRKLYSMSKGGFFRSKRHIKLYIDEHKMVKQK